MTNADLQVRSEGPLGNGSRLGGSGYRRSQSSWRAKTGCIFEGSAPRFLTDSSLASSSGVDNRAGLSVSGKSGFNVGRNNSSLLMIRVSTNSSIRDAIPSISSYMKRAPVLISVFHLLEESGGNEASCKALDPPVTITTALSGSFIMDNVLDKLLTKPLIAGLSSGDGKRYQFPWPTSKTASTPYTCVSCDNSMASGGRFGRAYPKSLAMVDHCVTSSRDILSPSILS
mmetsp:Transcript_24245/g.50397  ORF Transcript_24245/g.50397 Transcript_24245/m.50397 type:complete len:228 (-) Transcript_24245:96-779(-)